MAGNARTAATSADAEARRAVVEDLDRTLFVEAGAGSGKTRCLVDRFVALVESGVPAERIAAITFTEKAAGELADRIRADLGERARAGSGHCAGALAVLDRAAIGTLHAFAQRLLTEHPVEAGLPPRVTVVDEIASRVAFDLRWEAYVDELLEDPSMERPLRLLLASGGTLDHLHDVALAFDDNWDLVAERVDVASGPIPALDVGPLLDELEAVLRLRYFCTKDDDRLAVHLDGRVTDLARRLRAAGDDDARLGLLVKAQDQLKFRNGQERNWDRKKPEVVDRLTALEATCARLRGEVLEGVLQVLAASLARFTVAGAQARRATGELEFHDLLVLARALLRDAPHGPVVRAALARRYERLLLDEFQDTDPIQVELAVLLASDDPRAGEQQWQDVRTEPGRLFFVGDPKQSIYRFRRADIGMFLRARERLVGGRETLSRNFRTGRPIVEWVNATFGRLIHEVEDSQPAYLDLTPERPGPEVGPAVAFVGQDRGKVRADPLREAEAGDIVATVVRALDEGWSVGTGEASRPCRPSDIAILLPARTSLPFLERALDAASVPYRAETSSLVYSTPEVRDLLTVARAVDDPTDELSVVAALRTPGLGCGDDDLVTWRRTHHGRWDHQAPPPGGAPSDHPVAQGLAWLGRLHRERLWLPASDLLERIVHDRRLLELAVADGRPRDLWRRLRFVLDQCRAWEEAGGGTLRSYLQWVTGQSAEGARVVETVLPESDDEAVRILTVHGAKGLEFPVVVLSGLTTEMRSRPRGVEVRFPPSGTWAVKLRKGMSTADFEATKPLDEQMDHHERLRLLYVAATRARDHLVVSVTRKPGQRQAKTAAEVLLDAGSTPEVVHLEGAPEAGGVRLAPVDEAPVAAADRAAVGDLPDPESWRRDHEAAMAEAARSRSTSATRLAADAAARREAEAEAARAAAGDPGLAKGARDLDLPPWQKGRYGTAVGRAVHAVLQVVDLGTGAGLADASAAAAAAEGVIGQEAVIEALSRSLLASDVVRRAASRSHWREVYVGVPWADGVLEGYVDLLYRDDDGLVVVDHKTDAWRTEEELDAKVDRYAVQLRAYAHALAESTGESVARTLLLFASTDGEATVREVTGTLEPA